MRQTIIVILALVFPMILLFHVHAATKTGRSYRKKFEKPLLFFRFLCYISSYIFLGSIISMLTMLI